jgi:hypothetical protein
MLGVPVNDPTIMLGDNKAVLQNTTVPSSMLKKKHNAIAYHRVRESIAGGILRFFHIPSTENLADILTKPLGRHLFHQITEAILFSHRKAHLVTPEVMESPQELIPMALLCAQNGYPGMEACASDWAPLYDITHTTGERHVSEIETVLSRLS